MDIKGARDAVQGENSSDGIAVAWFVLNFKSHVMVSGAGVPGRGLLPGFVFHQIAIGKISKINET